MAASGRKQSLAWIGLQWLVLTQSSLSLMSSPAKRIRIIIAFSCVLTVMPTWAENVDEDVEVTFADVRVDWTDAPAYFVRAPKRMRAKLANAISRFLKNEPDFCDRKYANMWVCESKDYVFFRAISGGGRKTEDGMACSTTYEIPELKFYSGRMLATQAKCLELIWYQDDQEYAVYLAE